MARGRIISGSLGSSRKFSELHGIAGKGLGDFAQCLFPLVVVHCDDFGRMAGDAFSVKFECFPTSIHREQDFEKALQAMEKVELIRRYEVDGKPYLQVVNFDVHQSSLHKRTHSKFPEPPEDSGSPPEIPGNSRLSETKRNETKGNESNVGDAPGLPTECLELATEFRAGLLANKPTCRVPSDLRSWADTFRLMLERDRRTPERIREVFRWAQGHSFWCSNVLSADKLRDQFDQIEMQMARDHRGRPAALVSADELQRAADERRAHAEAKA